MRNSNNGGWATHGRFVPLFISSLHHLPALLFYSSHFHFFSHFYSYYHLCHDSTVCLLFLHVLLKYYMGGIINSEDRSILDIL
jgi:hypothetical protein